MPGLIGPDRGAKSRSGRNDVASTSHADVYGYSTHRCFQQTERCGGCIELCRDPDRQRHVGDLMAEVEVRHDGETVVTHNVEHDLPYARVLNPLKALVDPGELADQHA